MRSFLDWISCWSTTPQVSIREEVETPPSKEETNSLMPLDTEDLRKKKIRVRTGTSPQWKPTLRVITEDNVKAKKTPSEATKTTVDKVGKRKTTGGSRSKVHVRSYSNDTGRKSVPVVLPGLSPTPFMF
ncbi:uncharacterized protein LOC105779999 [Gossypium raimondii]|uniref:Uncharacterized protein n=2 Tax=Gossypium raimondii TaxID=29730 RepID=A0A0D2NJT2_GOSRA|nr:uncharacterized protein LOC105779999 [Gossypium raimondii]KJB13538.1 hypothetical protein B456_002G080100 [Gossypium raimondii]